METQLRCDLGATLTNTKGPSSQNDLFKELQSASAAMEKTWTTAEINKAPGNTMKPPAPQVTQQCHLSVDLKWKTTASGNILGKIH